MATKDIVKHEFKKGQSGNPKGRPPKLISTMIVDLKKAGYERVGASAIVDTFETLLNVPEEMLAEMIKDKSNPMSLRIVAKAMLSTKGWTVLQEMVDRAHGKAKQSTEVQGELTITQPAITVLTKESADIINEMYQAKLK
jgi:plasmid maintenance system antidote protein VapI